MTNLLGTTTLTTEDPLAILMTDLPPMEVQVGMITEGTTLITKVTRILGIPDSGTLVKDSTYLHHPSGSPLRNLLRRRRELLSLRS